MAQPRFALLIAALGAGVSACGGANANQTARARDPPSLPTLTGATITSSLPLLAPPDQPPYDAYDARPLPPTGDPLNTGDTPVFGEAPAPSATTSRHSTIVSAPQTALTLDDGQIAAIVGAENASKREQADVALRRADSPAVQMLARQIEADHAAANARLADLEAQGDISPVPGAVTKELESRHATVMEVLRSSTGRGFDRPFLNAQISDGKSMLELIDSTLLPQAQSARLRGALEELRASELLRVAAAQQLESSLATPKK